MTVTNKSLAKIVDIKLNVQCFGLALTIFAKQWCKIDLMTEVFFTG